jgi:hypothetical protein
VDKTISDLGALRERYPLTDEGLWEALKALGDTPEEIAAALRRLGIKGQQHNCADCPGARYLLAIWPDLDLVEFDVPIVQIRRQPERATVNPPEAVRSFVALFDNRQYAQDLVDRMEDEAPDVTP